MSVLSIRAPFPPKQNYLQSPLGQCTIGSMSTIKNLGIMYMCKSIHFECRTQYVSCTYQ